MQTFAFSMVFISLCNHIINGTPLNPSSSLETSIKGHPLHDLYTISLLSPSNRHFKRIRRSPTITSTTTSPEILLQASRKLKEVINSNGGFSKVNTDIQAAYNVMYSEEVQSDPILREAVKFNSKGHTCSVSLCNSIGQSQISLGACTPHFCHCGSGRAFVKTCGQGTIYDAFLQNCNWPNAVEYCTSN